MIIMKTYLDFVAGATNESRQPSSIQRFDRCTWQIEPNINGQMGLVAHVQVLLPDYWQCSVQPIWSSQFLLIDTLERQG